MKKQPQFAILLLVIGAIAIVLLAGGLAGLQKLSSLSKKDKAEYQVKHAQCEEIDAELKEKDKKEQLLADLNMSLNSIDQNLVNYEYIPTYLEQLQKTAVQTGNKINSIRPRGIEFLDINNPLLKASNEAWLKEHPVKKPIEAAQPADAKPQPKPKTSGRPKKAKSNYRVQQYAIEIEGDYVSIMKFLQALGQFPKLVYVRTINVSPRQRLQPDRLTARLETYAIIIPEHYQPVENPVAVPPPASNSISTAKGVAP
ncbi:MAG: hypothetical protein ACYDCO_02120 [Armatimonadota bacterium]